MSSIEHPSTPRTPPPVAEASEVHDENHGMPSAGESSPRPTSNRQDIEGHEVVKDTSICEDFLARHVRVPPSPLKLTDKMNKHIEKLRDANTYEKRLYDPAAKLLTAISKDMYRLLDADKKKAHCERYHLQQDTDACHLTFVDHHATPPTCFPSDSLSDVQDAPDLLGVYEIDIFEDNKGAKGVYKGVPHHRVEAIVEAKSLKQSGGRRQATTYAYRHHQARPDRPGFYVLVIKPTWYQVLYSDPTGVVASPQTPWTNTDLLAAYLYSHYDPPDGHFIWDDTIRWTEPLGPCLSPSWEITCDKKVYKNGRFIFIGEPWSRLTTSYNIEAPDGQRVIIKDSYRHVDRRFKEEAILNHIHGEGDFLGVVRLKVHETVTAGDNTMQFDVRGQGVERIRERWVFLDTGCSIRKARSVQDLLMAAYDALEVHRSQLLLRNVLHRDMSIHNLLMYPVWGTMEKRKVNASLPPMIEDVLAGSNRPVEKRFPSCLSIDYDNAAWLEYENITSEDLRHRTGTPMYIARGVCLGVVSMNELFCIAPPMPELSDEARALYVGAHGAARYERYNDTATTRHGARPPNTDEEFETAPRPQFRHRPEHDVESVYWSMVSALLRVHPKGVDKEAQAASMMINTWKILLDHEIPDRGTLESDPRQAIIAKSQDAWRGLFLDGMKDVGTLLWKISRHVNPEYVLWGDGLQPDHLHEAAQRLILQYLVDHKKPIELEPDYVRPITAPKKGTKPQLSQQVSTAGASTGAGSVERRVTRASTRSSKTRVDAEDGADGLGPIIIEPKRKSSSQTGRSSKRLRDNLGLPQPIEEHAEDAA